MSKGTPVSTEKALHDFEAAVEHDPAFALAWVGVGDAYESLSGTGFDWLSLREAQPRARAAAERALEIQPSGEAHAVLAGVARKYDRDWARAAEEYERALALSPGSAEVHREYSIYLRIRGREREAIAEAKEAIDLDPLSLPARDNLAWSYYYFRRFEEAEAVSRQTLSVEPNFPYAHLQLGLNEAAQNHPREALAEFEKVRQLTGDGPLTMAVMGYARGRLGEKEEALATLRKLRELSTRRYVPAYYVAAVYAGLRDSEKTLDWLEKAADEPSQGVSHLAVDPMADHLRDNPRFQALLQRMGLPILSLSGVS
jgi:tetratricopeptide (TPR) repeat protein